MKNSEEMDEGKRDSLICFVLAKTFVVKKNNCSHKPLRTESFQISIDIISVSNSAKGELDTDI